MRITKLHIRDFRGIRELDISFEPDITVVVGRNGAGKTSTLDALAQLMWTVVRPVAVRHPVQRRPKFPPRRKWEFSQQDIRIGAEALELRLDVAFEDPAQPSGAQETIRLTARGDQKDLSISDNSRLSDLVSSTALPPRGIYYRQHRGFEDMGIPDNPDQVIDPEFVQYASLQKELQAIGNLEVWWDHRDAQEARTVRDKGDSGYRDTQLEAVRRLITRIDSFSGIRFAGASIPRGLHLIKNDGTAVHVRSLSSGERSYIILLADLARRLQVFAPDTPLEETPAIVLIDEIELNLHPAWQSEILETLAHL